MKALKVLAILFLLYVAGQSIYLYLNERADRQRLEQNVILAKRGIEYYQTKDNKQVAKITAQEFTISEIKSGIAADVIKELKNMKIDVKSVGGFTQNIITNEKYIVTHTRDSIINDTVTAKVFSYNDAYYSIYGYEIDCIQHVNLSHIDSITQVFYKGDRYTKKGKKMPKWWFFTPKKLTQAIYCKDTTSKIIYSKYVNIVK